MNDSAYQQSEGRRVVIGQREDPA